MATWRIKTADRHQTSSTQIYWNILSAGNAAVMAWIPGMAPKIGWYWEGPGYPDREGAQKDLDEILAANPDLEAQIGKLVLVPGTFSGITGFRPDWLHPDAPSFQGFVDPDALERVGKLLDCF
jgi:hypothetical protein